MAIESWPAALRAHGIPVQLHNGFPNTPKPVGDLPDRIEAFYWHHDATPPGPTPGGLSWLINAYNSGQPSAQIWIDTKGVWHFGGAGIAYHAGVVFSLPNQVAVGAETDHTVNEAYPTVQLDSIRKGVAICAIQEGRNADFLVFHKTQAKPKGRKQDPWFDGQSNNMDNWGPELGRERGIVQRFINEIRGGGTTAPPVTGDDELSAAEVQRIIDEIHYGNDKIMEGKGGEPPNYNIKDTYTRIQWVQDNLTAQIEDLKKLVQGMYNTMVEPQFQGQGSHAYRDEVGWATDKVIMPKLNEIQSQLPKS